ncbi:MAG TPA: fibronectin type III domain-containing protein, partial [Candidatus Limnocylindrales bacterium]
MKRILVVLALVVAGTLTSAPQAVAAELAVNGGFESGSLSPWSCTGNLGTVVTSPVHSGARALQGAASSSDNARCTQSVSGLVSGTSYTLSGWFRGNYTYLGINGGASTWTPGGASYTQLSLTFTATSTSVQIYFHGWYGQGTYHADDISLQGQGGGGGGVPGAPSNLASTGQTASSISLSWNGSSGTVTGYRVYEGSTQRAQVTGLSATISGLGTCTSHTYVVRAYNASGESGNSNSVTVSTSGCAGVPGAPGNNRVTGQTNSSISLAWNASSGTVTGYRVYEGSTQRAQVTGLSATISGLGTCTSHTYVIRAYNSSGESPNSNSVTGSTTGCPTTTAMAAPYLYMGWGSPPSVSTVMSATGIRQFTMAFMLSGGGCVPMWDSSRPLTGGVDQQTINAIRAGGGDVQISFGGWSGNKLGPNCSTPQALANAYQQVINAYNLRFIDIDIENTDEFENEAVQDRILNALKIVKQNNPSIKTIITFGTSQSGPTFWGTRLINQSRALQANIDNFTIMPFDFGCTGNMFTCTTNAAEGLKNALKTAYGWN